MKEDRIIQLRQIARIYVEEGLGKGNFDIIPYAEDVSLRAPLNPGGSESPIVGKSLLRGTWWKPLPDLVEGTELLATYINTNQDAVAVEFYCNIKSPNCRLRIVDRFKVDESGLITDQENFFDPRLVTDPN